MTTTIDRPPAPPSPPDKSRYPHSLEKLGEIAASDTWQGRLGRNIALALAFLVVVEAVFHLSLAYLIDGIALGSLYGIIGVGLVLIYRTTRVINFAAAAIGAVPAIIALMLDVLDHVSYLETLPIVLVGGPLVGALVDLGIMRRFSRSPRLIVTVVTIGVAQTLAILGFFIPIWLGQKANEIPNVPTPWANFAIHNSRGQPVLTGNQIAALVVVVVLAAALAVFLRSTRIGIALRASAENADRAALLGIPVKLLGTVAWMIAGLLAAMAIFVQAPLIGVPSNATLGFDTLLYALAAAVVAKMDNIGMSLGAGAAVGILVFASVASNGSSDIASALMLIVILGALLVQRRSRSRAYDTGVETWRVLNEFRPIPAELRDLPEVATARVATVATVIALAVALPFVVGGSNLPDLVQLPIYGIVAVSLVVLTGWAGQISLGQFGLVGVGAAAAGGLVANHNIDFFAALGIGIGAGVVAAIIIGLPALRIQGLYLAVTTLAFAYAVEYYVLNPNYPIGAHILPTGYTAHLERPWLWQRISLDSDKTFYFVCLIFLALAMLAASSFRKYRSGRVLIAARDNQRAASSYGINVARSRLAAFAVSGGIAGMAGVLLAYSEHNVIAGAFSPEYSIIVFLAAVIGGLSSLPFAVMGTIALEAGVLFIPKLQSILGATVITAIPLIITGPSVILTLMQYPSGQAQGAFKLRDAFLRRVAARHNLLVPSLVADRMVSSTNDLDAIDLARQHFESNLPGSNGHQATAGTDGDSGQPGGARPAITCPVCGDQLSLDAASSHPHLIAPTPSGTNS